jgi:hypothetical protein
VRSADLESHWLRGPPSQSRRAHWVAAIELFAGSVNLVRRRYQLPDQSISVKDSRDPRLSYARLRVGRVQEPVLRKAACCWSGTHVWVWAAEGRVDEAMQYGPVTLEVAFTIIEAPHQHLPEAAKPQVDVRPRQPRWQCIFAKAASSNGSHISARIISDVPEAIIRWPRLVPSGSIKYRVRGSRRPWSAM